MGAARLIAVVLPLSLVSACGPSASIYRGGYALVDADVDVPPSGGGGNLGVAGAGGASGSGGGGSAGVSGNGGRDAGGGTGASGGSPGYGGVPTGGGGSGGMGTGGGGGTGPMDTGAGGTGATTDAPPATTAMLEASVGSAVTNTNLTQLGKVDWVHWGHGRDVSAINRKRNVAQVVSNFTKIGGRALGTYNDRPSAHSWSDGAPNVSITNTKDGMVTGDAVGVGFELRITGRSQTVRNVRVYVGAWEAATKMTVQLENSGLAPWTDKSLVAQGISADRTYTFTFRPKSDTDALVIRWTTEQLFHMYGNVTLQAAAVWD